MPRNFSAPGVYRQEIDQSNVLVPTGISTGGVVVWSQKGPINRPVLVTTDKEYIDTFGKPIFTSGVKAAATQTSLEKQIPEFGYGSYAALQFLQESSNLYVVRSVKSGSDYYAGAAVASTLTFGSSAIAATLIADGDVYDSAVRIKSIDNFADSGGAGASTFNIGALGPGIDGNNIAVTVESFSTSADWKLFYDTYPTQMSAVSGTVTTAVSAWYPIASKVFKINVYTKETNKAWTDYYLNTTDQTASKLRLASVETFYGSLDDSLQDSDGNNLFIETAVNGKSKYIYVKKGVSLGTSFSFTTTQPTGTDSTGNYVLYTSLTRLGGGVSYTPGYDALNTTTTSTFFMLKNREEVPNLGIVIGTSYDTTYKQELSKVAGARLDCIVTNQTGELNDETVTDIINSELYGYNAPSYVALYCGYSKIYDQYNDKFVMLPNSIFGAAVMARTDNRSQPWFAPAGTDRGILSVVEENKKFSETEIGNLYNRNINPIKFRVGIGNFIDGQKTAQLKKSALDRINVRRALLYIENNIEPALLPFLFELNDARTRLRIFTLIDNFLAGVKAAGGLYDYRLVCDETNNTSQVIDNNQLNVDVYVQVAKAIEFIQLTTIVTRSGISLQEIQ